MAEILEEPKEPSAELTPISAYIWKPWYAKLYWSLTPSLWLVGSDWVQNLPEAVGRGLMIVSIFTVPPVVFLVLAFGWLEKFIHDPNRVRVPMERRRSDQNFWDDYDRRKKDIAIMMDQYDVRSPNYYMNHISDPRNPHHRTFKA